jgi:hypothetical protein
VFPVWSIPIAVAAIGTGAWLLLRRRITPEEQERRRRLQVNAAGRITDALITEVRTLESAGGAVSHLMHYTYTIRGVTYAATQDITGMLAHLDRDPERLLGPAGVKYVPKNPYNSIVICEEWSGLR